MSQDEHIKKHQETLEVLRENVRNRKQEFLSKINIFIGNWTWSICTCFQNRLWWCQLVCNAGEGRSDWKASDIFNGCCYDWRSSTSIRCPFEAKQRFNNAYSPLSFLLGNSTRFLGQGLPNVLVKKDFRNGYQNYEVRYLTTNMYMEKLDII